MKIKRIYKKIILFSFITVIALFIVIFAISFFQPELPVKQINSAREVLFVLGEAEITKYAPGSNQQIYELWDSLLDEWRRQNNIIIGLKDYSKISSISDSIVSFAEKTLMLVEKLKYEIMDSIESNMALLDDLLQKFEVNYKNLPLSENIYHDYFKADLLYAEGLKVLERKDYKEACGIFEKAKQLSIENDSIIHASLLQYFMNYPLWNTWIKETIQNSMMNKSYALIIDKFANSCLIYYNGNLINSFYAEFGPNWIGDKNHTGDLSTPEGKYFVTKVMDIGKTNFYKALLINYPDDKDYKRYQDAVNKGDISPNQGIGGHIEIHGNGGQGRNWTDGCIALIDEDMDEVFKIAVPGTPVTIVGSSVPFSKVIK